MMNKKLNDLPSISSLPTLPISNLNLNLPSKVHPAHSEVIESAEVLCSINILNYFDKVSVSISILYPKLDALPKITINHCLIYVNPCAWSVVTQCQMSTRSSTPVGRFGPLSGGHLKRETYSSVWMRLATVANKWLSEELTNPYL